MFDKGLLKENEDLKSQWRERWKELYGERNVEGVTAAGIKVKPVYTPSDIDDMNYKEIGYPGQYPFTRGNTPGGYLTDPWHIFTGFGFGGGTESRERWEFLKSIGAYGRVGQEHGEDTSFRMVIDLPTQRGLDPDDPAAKGRVGGCGLSVSNIKEVEALLDGVDLENICVQFSIFDPSMIALAMYIVYAERRGVPQEKLFMRANNTLYDDWYEDVIGYPPRYVLRLMTEMINYTTRFMPRVQHTSLSGYNMREGGASLIQAIAFNLSVGMTVTEECVKAGLDPDEVVQRFYHHETIGLDLLESVASLRAKRRLWAKLFKERFGCKKPESLQCKMLVQTSGHLMVAQEPLNNIIRVTIMSLASVLAGVEGIFSTSYDEPLCIPTEEAVTIAIRTQQILYHETGLANVADPLGGSYYLEWLTNRIEEEVLQYLHKIEELGGFLKCWESGWVKQELEKSANEREQKIESGEIVQVGRNKYRLPEERQPKLSSVFPLHDPRAEEEIIARVKKYKAERDSIKTKTALEQVRQAAIAIKDKWPSSCGVLMPAIIDAVRADATLGEISSVLTGVLGYGYVY